MQRSWLRLLATLALFASAMIATDEAAAITLSFSDPTSTGSGIGETALYSNVGTQDGVALDLLATVLDQWPVGQNNGLNASNGDLRISLADGVTNATKWMTVQYQFFESGTQNPVVVSDMSLTTDDLDGYSSRIESIKSSGISGYTLNASTGVLAELSNDTYTFVGNANHNTGDSEGMATVDYLSCSAFWITYQSEVNATGGAAAFYHDGNGGFAITDPIVTDLLPRLYYTYNFNNNGNGDGQVDADDLLIVDFFDSLPEGVVWDTGYVPVITGDIQVNVVYSNANRDAAIQGLEIPLSGSTLTLRTITTEQTGTIDNEATITPVDPGLELAAAVASINLDGLGTADPTGGPVGQNQVPPLFVDFCGSGLSQFAVTVLDGGNFGANNENSGVSGDVAIAPGAGWVVGQGFVSGEFVTHPGTTGSGGDTQAGTGGDPLSPVIEDLSGLRNEALILSAQAAALPSTQTLGAISGSSTITATASDGLNVVAVDNIDLVASSILTISGGADDFFVINVSDYVWMSGNAAWVLSGGILPENVIFNMLPGSGEFTGRGIPGSTGGIVLAPHSTNDVQITGGNEFTGAVICGDEFTASGGSHVVAGACAPAAPTPSIKMTTGIDAGSWVIAGDTATYTFDSDGTSIVLTEVGTSWSSATFNNWSAWSQAVGGTSAVRATFSNGDNFTAEVFDASSQSISPESIELHIDRIGGTYGTGIFTLQGGVEWIKTAGNNGFVESSTTVETNLGGTNQSGGSIELSESVSSFTITNEAATDNIALQVTICVPGN